MAEITKQKNDERWTTSTAIKKAAEIGVSISPPTVIKICIEHDVGYQITGQHGTWLIYPEKFMKIIKGDWKE